MIINVKSMMAAVMATILVLAVVLPIASSMVGLSAEKVYGNNTLEEGEYLMSETGKNNPRLAVLDTDSGVQLSVTGHRETVTDRTVIFSDTFVVDFTTGYFKIYYNENDTTGYYTSDEGDYVAMDRGVWKLYVYTDDPVGGGAKSDGMTKEQVLEAFSDPVLKESLMGRIPASNLQQFSEKELEDMAREGMDVLRSVTVSKQGHYNWIVFPDSEGDMFYAISGENRTVYVDSDSMIYSAGASIGTDGRAVLKGTLTNMQVVHAYYEIDPTNISCVYTADGYSNALTDITYSDSHGDSYDLPHFIVPVQYTIDKEVGLAGTLVGLVPVVLIVGLIVGLVSVHLIRRGEDF